VTGPQPLPKRVVHRVFIIPLPVSSRFLNIIHWLLTSYSSSSRPVYLSFNNLFQKTVPTQDVTNPVNTRSFTACRIFQSSFAFEILEGWFDRASSS